MKNIIKYFLELVLVVILGLSAVGSLPAIFESDKNQTTYLFFFFGLICALGVLGIVFRWIKVGLGK